MNNVTKALELLFSRTYKARLYLGSTTTNYNASAQMINIMGGATATSVV